MASPSFSSLNGASPPERLRMPPKPAKASLDAPKNLRKLDEWRMLAGVMAHAITLSGLTQKQVAAHVGLTESQLSDQLRAEERPQIERFHADDVLAGPTIAALARRKRFPVVFSISIPLAEMVS